MLRAASQRTSVRITKKALLCFLTSMVMLLILPVFAADKQKDEETLRHANLVLQDMQHQRHLA